VKKGLRKWGAPEMIKSNAERETRLFLFTQCHPADRKIGLKQRHKEARVGFSLEHYALNDEFWDNVVFTDEKIFRSRRNGRILIYRPN
jgi:hypothetical protein